MPNNYRIHFSITLVGPLELATANHKFYISAVHHTHAHIPGPVDVSDAISGLVSLGNNDVIANPESSR